MIQTGEPVRRSDKFRQLEEILGGNVRREHAGYAIDGPSRRAQSPTGLTTANKITILRILLVPFFVTQVLYYVKHGEEMHRLFALLCFAVAALSDGVDGYIARRYNQRSELGAVLDPLADKLLLVSAVVVLSFDHEPWLEQLPLWFTGTIIGRDVVLLIGTSVVHHMVGKARVQPHLTGKVATVLQMITVLWTLLKWDAQWLLYWCIGAAVFTGVSGVLYVFDGVRQLSASPSSSPKAEQ